MSASYSESYDVAGRLAQGRPAVDTVAQYVRACHQLGYQHPDLTMHPSQCSDWYGTEDGMDLAALHRDCLALDAAVRSAHDALAVQEGQLAHLSAVWQGVGAQAAGEFLRRHGAASVAVAAAVRTAAAALTELREELWRVVGAKVDATVAIEERAAGARAEWLAASTTVTTGAGDRAAASELVDQAVKPFVDTSVRTDWLTAMRAAVASVTAAYERAVAEIEAEQPPVFGVPGDLGPAWTPSMPAVDDGSGDDDGGDMDPAPIAERTAPATVPSAWSAPPMAAPGAPPAPAAPVPLAEPAVAAPAPAAAAPPPPAEPPLPAAPVPPAPPLGSMGSGMPDLGGGLSGLGQQLADTLSGLLGGAGGDIPELEDVDVEPPDLPEDDEDDEDPVEDEDVEEPQEDSEEPVPEEDATGSDDAIEVPVEPPAEPAAAPTPPPPPPPAEPLPSAEPVGAPQTPCEVAADEVPQVGGAPE